MGVIMGKVSYIKWAREYAEKHGVTKSYEEKLKASQEWERINAMQSAPLSGDGGVKAMSDKDSRSNGSRLNRVLFLLILLAGLLWAAGRAELYFKYRGLSQDQIAKEKSQEAKVGINKQQIQYHQGSAQYVAEDQLSKVINASHDAANLMDRIGGSDAVCHMLADQIRARANQMSGYNGAGTATREQAAQQLANATKQFMAEGNARGCYGRAP